MTIFCHQMFDLGSCLTGKPQLAPFHATLTSQT